MAQRFVFSMPPANPLMQAVYLVVGAIVVFVSLLLGAVVLAIVFGIALIFGAILWIRIWWLRRRFMRDGRREAAGTAQRRSGGVEITGVEYRVVRETDPNEPKDRE